jgi:hypothetical protein
MEAGAVLSIVVGGGGCGRCSLLWGPGADKACFEGVQCDVACLWVCIVTYLVGTLL